MAETMISDKPNGIASNNELCVLPQQDKLQETYQAKSKRVFNPPLSMQRYTYILNLLEKETEITSVTDLGSGNCRLMIFLKSIKNLKACNFVEIDCNILDFESHYNAQPLPWDYIFGRPGAMQDLQVNVYQGDMTSPDCRLMKSDVITMVEVIEHLQPEVLTKIPLTIFGIYRPKVVVITTPNREFNSLFFGDDHTKLRHWDHKFEWTRAEFKAWCSQVTSQYPDYFFELDGLGHLLPDSQDLGPCTQIAIFRKLDMFNLSLSHSIESDDVEMDPEIEQETLFGDPLNLHSSYTYPGQKIAPPEPDTEIIDWRTVT